MVDLAEIQAAYYMVAATGVLVAAAYYVLNMRETSRNRRSNMANTYMQYFNTDEFQLKWMEVLNMQFSDFEDFKRKYDSSVNPQSYAKRMAIWNIWDSIGRQVREGFIDLDDLGSSSEASAVMAWRKFKPIIEGYRGWQMPKDAWSNFEYIANICQKRLRDRDPEFMKKMDTFFTTPGVAQ